MGVGGRVFIGAFMNDDGRHSVSAVVTHLPGEPVIIISVAEGGETTSWRRLHERVAELMKQIDGAVYCITDFSGVQVSFDMMAAMLREETRGRPGSASDPRVREALVGSSAILKLAAQSLSQPHYIGEDVPVFASLAEALHYVRSRNGRRIGWAALAGAQ